MAIDPRYVASQDLESLFVNKETGELLADGEIYFYEDDNRSNLKPVFQLTGAPPNYTFTQLPNPVTLSMISTPSNVGDDNIAVYYYPYDAQGNVQLYYVVVKGADAVDQFTREAWPPNCWTDNGGGGASGGGGGSSGSMPTNFISNPQFVDVNFDPNLAFTISIPGTVTATDYAIAPGWAIRATTTGAATIGLTRNNIAGNAGWPNNPAYSLTITPGGSITALALVQSFDHNPGIWSALQNNDKGFVATNLTLGIPASTATVVYTPVATGVTTTLLTATNNSGLPVAFTDTVQLPPANNTSTSTTGAVDFVINIQTSLPTEITSIQVTATDTLQEAVPYTQEPVARQQDHLAHYYKPQLAFKPIPSYLVGWNFKQNPAQVTGDSVAPQAVGANKSYYTWDQTIIFQTANSGVTVSRSSVDYTAGALRLTAAQNGQVAIIQYLDQSLARELLCNRLAVNIWSSTSLADGLNGTVTLWATTSANLPDMNSPNYNSIVATLDSNGAPATFNGSWTEIPRGGLPRNIFKSEYQSSTSTKGYPFRVDLNGWEYPDSTAAIVDGATFFAIVIGWEAWATNDYLDIMNVALCTGDIATNWAPKSADETLRDCERYYEKSYASQTPPGTVTSVNKKCATHGVYLAGGNTQFNSTDFGFTYRSLKRVATPIVTLYSPSAGTASNVDAFIWQNVSQPTALQVTPVTKWTLTAGDKSAYYQPTGSNVALSIANPNAGSAVTSYHYVVDARLGIVN